MTPPGVQTDARATAEAVARRGYGKLIAFLAARTRDVAAAEDALSDAFASALITWPERGCPANPEAWLLTAARRKLIDAMRGQRRHELASEQLNVILETTPTAEPIPDERLAMMFACAHPDIEAASRAPLILQVVLGLDAKAIGSAFLVSPSSMGKRLVRAKEKIRQAGISFRVPEREELSVRLGSVLDAVYAAYTEGWVDAHGSDAVRRDLTEEALFLARLVSSLMPEQPEALGLLALLLHSEARRRARRNAEGNYVPLAEQDLASWDMPMVLEAESLIRRASAYGAVGRYQLEAALQSAHVYRGFSGHANWEDVLQLYNALYAITGSPVVAVNRALAIAEVHGAVQGLEALEAAAASGRLTEYQPYWAARAELLATTDALADAHHAYEIAIGLERDPAVRRFLQHRQQSLRPIG